MMRYKNSDYAILSNKIAGQFQLIDSVTAIALGGSNTGDSLDKHSDIDLYIYSNEIIPLSTRQAIVDELGASRTDLNLTFWDLGDEWFDLETGIEVDIIYWAPAWIEAQLERVVISHQANMGYTTCFWRTILSSKILFDRDEWLTKLQKRYDQPYPEALKQAIIARNYPVLRGVIPSYYGQIKKAIARKDLISVNHRLAALLAGYFDILFAVNEVRHPGEKKILRYVEAECERVPVKMQQQIEAIFLSAGVGDEALIEQLDELLNGLDDLLISEGFDNPSRENQVG